MAVFFPREAITSDNFVPVVNIVTWILLVSMVLAVCTKVAMKVIGRHTFNIDDSVLVAAMVILSGFLALSKLRKRFCVSGRQRCAIDYFLCTDLQWRRTSFGVPHHLAGGDIREGPTLGLGVQRRILTKTQAGYSADLLYIIALAISKVSVLVLLWQITPVAVHRRMTLGVGSFIAAWTLASFFASVFQCSTPDTWMILSQHCFDRVWIANLNIRTGPLCDTAYTPTDLILDHLRYHKHTDRSHLNTDANLYYWDLAHVKSAESGGYLMLRHPRPVGAALIMVKHWLSKFLE